MSFMRPALEAIHKMYPPSVGEPPSRSTLMLATQTPLMVITTFVVGLRIISRSRVARVEPDDWLILAATVCSIGLYTSNIVSIRYGMGLHIWDTKIDLLEPAQKNILANEIFFTFTAGLSKLSILVFYMRVFSAYENFRYFGWGGLFYVSSYMISAIIAAFTQCRPLRAFWVPDVKDFMCVDMYAGIIALTVLNSLSDVYIFAIPIQWVWKLKLPTKQRVGLIFTFGLGLIACIVGVVRIKYLKLAIHDSPDLTWHIALTYILGLLETDLGIICASLPALRPLFAKIFPSFRANNKPNKHSNGVKEISRVWRRFNLGVIGSGVGEGREPDAAASAATASTSRTGATVDLTGKESKEHIRLGVRTTIGTEDNESV